jgi:two-component system osmolarity sensor histidine kinase EnvZ
MTDHSGPRITSRRSLPLWPRSLLWRSVLLIALLLIIANLAWLQIVRVSEREPRAHQAALQIVSVVNLTRAALITAQPSKRYDLLTELSQREGIQVYLPEPRETLAPLPDRAFIQLVAAELRRSLGPETRMTLTRNGVRGVWVSFAIDEDEYWVFMPRSRVERNDSLRWIGWGALVLLLALVGSYLIVARINRPLRQLTRAAARMGRGATPAPVSETGPTEIRTVARAFNQLAADLKRLDDERALLLAGVSHDLRTPLSRIRLGIELLDDRGDTALKEGLEEDISEIDKAIGQFLDFARLTQPEAVTQESDLNALVEAVVSRYAEGPHHIGFDRSPVSALPLRKAAMQRLVVNLIENALRHGGAEVSVATGCDAGNAWVEVRDHGPGIPAEDAERMLQPFTRLDSARGGASGTGLGLAIVDRIARMHGGRVRLLPRPGGGLIARVELPLSPRGAQVEASPHPARQAA